MSNDKTEVLQTSAPAPTRRSILHAASASIGQPAAVPAQPERRPFADWRGQAQTEEMPAVPPSPRRRDRPARRSALARHLRSALAGILIAVALLTGLQLYAAAGISSARQAALAERDAQAATTPAPTGQAGMPDRADAPAAQWTVEGTTTAAPSPLDLPRCTTSPDTPLPCLATISPDSGRAVVLEEDTSLTALVRR